MYTDAYNDGTGIVEFSRYEDFRRALRDMDDSKFRSHEVGVVLTHHHCMSVDHLSRGRQHTFVLRIQIGHAVPRHITTVPGPALALGPGPTEQHGLRRKLLVGLMPAQY